MGEHHQPEPGSDPASVPATRAPTVEEARPSRGLPIAREATVHEQGEAFTIALFAAMIAFLLVMLLVTTVSI